MLLNRKILGKHNKESPTEPDITPTKRLKSDKQHDQEQEQTEQNDTTPTSPTSHRKKTPAKQASTSLNMTIGKPTQSPPIPPIPITTNPATLPLYTPPPSSSKKAPALKKDGTERKTKNNQMAQEEFNNLISAIENGQVVYQQLESQIDSDFKRFQSPNSPLNSSNNNSPIMSPIMSPSPTGAANSIVSRLLTQGNINSIQLKEHDKKPRILKSDHLPKLSKGPKVSKKIEKLQKKYIRYFNPSQDIRGDWTVRDDYNLLEQIQLGTSLDILVQDYSKYFTRQYSIDEIHKRWKSLLYDVDTSDEGVGLMVLHPFTPKHPPLTELEKSLLYNSQIIMEKSYFANLIQENRSVFHSSRTSKFLLETFKHMLLNQDVSKFPNYVKFLYSQKDKIKQFDKFEKKPNTTTNNSVIIDNNNNNNSLPNNIEQHDTKITTTTTTTTTNTNTTTHTNQIEQEKEKENGIDPQSLPIINPNDIPNENYNELMKFLYNNSFESLNNIDQLTNKTKWDSVLTSNLTRAGDIQNDLILNPFLNIPQYLLSAKNEKDDMKQMVKIEREYELDKDRESRSLAIIRGKNIRYLMKSKDIIIGRNFSEKNIIDLDLLEEQPTNINLISKKQIIIKLKSDVNFYIQNIGKNNVFVNGCPIPPNEKIHLQDLSLIEFAGIRIVFEMNKVFLAKVKRHISILSSLKQPSNKNKVSTSTPATLETPTTTITSTPISNISSDSIDK